VDGGKSDDFAVLKDDASSKSDRKSLNFKFENLKGTGRKTARRPKILKSDGWYERAALSMAISANHQRWEANECLPIASEVKTMSTDEQKLTWKIENVRKSIRVDWKILASENLSADERKAIREHLGICNSSLKIFKDLADASQKNRH
jgi:hypothetical protein